MSNEPDDGLGDGHSTGDVVFGPSDLCVRRERSGLGDGRVYTATIKASDFSGNATTKTIEIVVPHAHQPGCKPAGTVLAKDQACL